jgi:hypothetical protein
MSTDPKIENSIRNELIAVRKAIPLAPGDDGSGVNVATGAAADRSEKNYARRLSDLLAIKVADGLRHPRGCPRPRASGCRNQLSTNG